MVYRMKVLVTGAAGFIGYHTCLALKKSGHEIVGIDSFNNYYDVNLKLERQRQLKRSLIDVHTIKLTGTMYSAYQSKLFELLTDVDLVVHLAAYAGVRYSMDHPAVYIDNNISGTQTLIDLSQDAGVEKIVYASTSSVMAGQELPWKETDPSPASLNPYAASKKMNETQFTTSKIPTTIGLRFFTVYGPWGRPDMALFSFTKNIKEGKPIPVFNNGDMVRDFTYIDDIVQGILIAVNETENGPSKEIYNIGRGEKVNLMDFIREIETCVGKEAIVKFEPMHPADTQATWSDTTKLQALGYKPTTSIKEGVRNFVDWYNNYYR